MLHFKITIEVIETGATKTFEREGIENTLELARKFMWESLPRLIPLTPDSLKDGVLSLPESVLVENALPAKSG